MIKVILQVLSLLFAGNACSLKPGMIYNQRQDGHLKLYTYPDYQDKNAPKKERYKRIVLVGLNDLRSEILPKIEVYNEKNFNLNHEIKKGGLAATKAYLDILKKKYSSQIILAHAGSNFSNKVQAAQTNFLLNHLEFDVSMLGLEDFQISDSGSQDFLKSVISQSQMPYLATNIFNLAKAQEIDWQGTKNLHMIERNGIKIGFFSVLPPSVATRIPKKDVNRLYFQNSLSTIISSSKSLRKLGADVVIMLYGSGLDCTDFLSHQEQLPKEKVNFVPRDQSVCDLFKNELASQLKKLSPGTVDAVISSNKSSKVANFIYGIPVLQTFGGSEYLSWAELFFDTKAKLVEQSKTIIHQPVHTCYRHIKATKDCYTKEKLITFNLNKASFMKEKIKIFPLPANK